MSKFIQTKAGKMENNHNAELYAALSKAQGEFPEIQKTKTNPFFKSKYADHADVRKAVQPTLTKHGLSVIQVIQDKELVTILAHSSGGQILSSIPIRLTGKPQEIGSEITYMRRYSLCAILNVVADDDDDGNGASEQNKGKAEVRKPDKFTGKVDPKKTVTTSQLKRLRAISAETQWTFDNIKALIKQDTGKTSSKELNMGEYDKICKTIQSMSFDDWYSGLIDESDELPNFAPGK